MEIKKFIKFVTLTLVVVISIQALIRGTNVYYSGKLIKEIKDDDIEGIERIMDRCPSCIDYYPGFAPLIFYGLMEVPMFFPIMHAVWEDDPLIVQTLVDAGANLDCTDGARNPLYLVYRNKNTHWYEISCILIEGGADVNYVISYSKKARETGDICILDDIVSWTGRPADKEELMKAFEYALDHCDHSRVDWCRTLWFAAREGRAEIVRLLLDGGYCDVNGEYDDVGTALIAAVQAIEYHGFSNKEMIELLLYYGADKDMKDEKGLTAYDYAVLCSNQDAMELLG